MELKTPRSLLAYEETQLGGIGGLPPETQILYLSIKVLFDVSRKAIYPLWFTNNGKHHVCVIAHIPIASDTVL